MVSKVKALDDTGKPVGEIPNQALYSYTIAAFSSDQLFVPGMNGQTVILKIVNGGTLGTFFVETSVTNINHNLNLDYAVATGTDPYVYVSTKQTGEIYKFDTSNPICPYTVSDYTMYSSLLILEILDPNRIVLYSRIESLFVVMTALDLTFTTTATQFVGNVAVFKVDPAAPSVGYAASLGAPFELRKIDIASTADMILGPTLALSSPANSIILLGTQDYLLLAFDIPVLQLV